MKLNLSGSAPEFAALLAGFGYPFGGRAGAIAVAPDGSVCGALAATSTGFPVTDNAFQRMKAGGSSNDSVYFFRFEPAGFQACVRDLARRQRKR